MKKKHMVLGVLNNKLSSERHGVQNAVGTDFCY